MNMQDAVAEINERFGEGSAWCNARQMNVSIPVCGTTYTAQIVHVGELYIVSFNNGRNRWGEAVKEDMAATIVLSALDLLEDSVKAFGMLSGIAGLVQCYQSGSGLSCVLRAEAPDAISAGCCDSIYGENSVHETFDLTPVAIKQSLLRLIEDITRRRDRVLKSAAQNDLLIAQLSTVTNGIEVL